MSAMPASSTTSSDPARGVSWPRRHWSSSECSVRAGMPAPPASSIAARADGAAPTTGWPACSKAARTASRVKVLPVPAGPTITAIGCVPAVIVRTAASWSSPRDRPAKASFDGRLGERVEPCRCRHGGEEASLDVDQLPARPSRRLPVSGGDGEHLVGGEDTVGDPLDRLHRRALPLPGGDGADQVRLGERGGRGGQLGAQQVGDPLLRVDDPLDVLGSAVLVEHDGVEPPPPVGRRAGPLPGPARRGARRHPVPTRPRRPRPSSPRRSVRARPRACGAGWPAPPPGDPPGVSGVPVAASQASISCDRFENPSSSDWGMPAISGTWRPGRHSTPSDAVQLVAEHRLEHLAGGAGVAVQVGAEQGAPPAVAALGHVGDQGVPVQQRISGSGGAMPERRRHHPRRRQLARPGAGLVGVGGQPRLVVGAAPHLDRLALQPAHRRPHRRLTGFDHRPLHPGVVGHGVEDRRRLRRLERQIEARHPAGMRTGVLPVRRQPAPARGQAGEHRPQIIGVDVTVEAEPRRRRRRPTRRSPRRRPCSRRRGTGRPRTAGRPPGRRGAWRSTASPPNGQPVHPPGENL